MLISSLGREDFAARLDTLATGVRLVQEQRNRQRRAGRLRGAQVAVELQGLRQELGSMKTAFKRSGKQLFEEVAESFLAGVRLAQQKQAQTADAAAALSLTVFLASKQHITQELHCAALAGEQLRANLDGIKQALEQGKSQFKRDAESILEAIRRHADPGQKELAALKAQRILWTNERTQLQRAAALSLSQVAASKAATAKAEDKLTSAELELTKIRGELAQVKVVLNETKGAAAKERERVAKETEVLVFQKSSLSETSAKTIVDLQTQVWRFQAAQSVAPVESHQISSKKAKPRDVNAQFYAAEGLDYYIPPVERPSVSKKGASPSTIMSSSPSPQRAPSAPIPPLAACGHCEDGLASILEVEKTAVVLGALAETAGWGKEGKRTQGSEKEKEGKNREEREEEESGPKRGGGKRGREMRAKGGFAEGDASGNHRSARREGERYGEGSTSSTATHFEQQQKAVQEEVQENQKGQQKEGGMAMDETEKEPQKQPSRELLQQPLQKLQQPLPSRANSNKRQREMTDVEGTESTRTARPRTPNLCSNSSNALHILCRKGCGKQMVKGGVLTKHEKSCRSQRHLRIPAVSLSGQDVLKPGDRVEGLYTSQGKHKGKWFAAVIVGKEAADNGGLYKLKWDDNDDVDLLKAATHLVKIVPLP